MRLFVDRLALNHYETEVLGIVYRVISTAPRCWSVSEYTSDPSAPVKTWTSEYRTRIDALNAILRHVQTRPEVQERIRQSNPDIDAGELRSMKTVATMLGV